MITGNINANGEKLDFEIAEGWHELTLDKFEQFNDEVESLDMFSILSGIDLDIIKMCDVNEVDFLVNQIEQLYDPKELQDVQDTVDSVTINNRVFNVPESISGIKAGQYYDIKKIEQMYQSEPIKAIRKLLSLLLLEEGKEYDYNDCKEKEELFKQIDVLTAFKIRTFFLSSQLASTISLNHSSNKKLTLKRLLQGMILLTGSSVLYLPSIILRMIKRLSQRYSEKKKR